MEEINAAMITNWNRCVGSMDTIYHLGDVTLRGLDRFIKIMGQLNGRIIIVPGNHDRNWLRQWRKHDRPEIKSLCGQNILILEDEKGWIMCLENTSIFVSHGRVIPLVFNDLRNKYEGLIHLHGHSHGKNLSSNYIMDVGVDCHAFYPISLDSIKQKLYN